MQPDEAGLFAPFRGGAAYFFKVNTEIADAWEHGTGWMVLESTLLHESVHWVRYNAVGSGKYQWADDGREVGVVFEQAAYGFSTAQRGANGKLIQFGPPETLPTIKPRN
jgi:hypothetical protein